MKRILKTATYIFSLGALMTLVFSTNLVNKLSKEGSDIGQNGKKDASDGLFSAFETTKAYADVYGFGGGEDGGSSADGAGCSACGASDGGAGDGCGGDGGCGSGSGC